MARLDKFYQIRGWDIRSATPSNSLIQDTGDIRSDLDKFGIGVIGMTQSLYAQNLLDTPLKTPQTYTPSANRGAVGAGNQVYNGERPTFATGTSIFVTYDASRLNIPDGQVVLAVDKLNATWQPLIPNLSSVNHLTYYQTLFDKKLEFNFGIMSNTSNFIGANIGGSFATTFGPAALIHVLLGMSYIASPAINVQYNVTSQIYSKAGVQRSDPVHGPTGNPIYDGAKENPTGLTFSTPQDGVFAVDEIGYRVDASPGVPQTWLRAAGMYNNSRFQDFTKLTTDPAATLKGNAGAYVLGDRQLLQTAPGSPFTAYRGLYVGGTFEFAPAQTTPITQYWEGRVYSLGPFDSRPADIVSFVYSHQVFSRYIPDLLNPISQAAANFGIAVPMAYHASNAYTASYLALVAPGVFLSAALGYTDHPSTTYFRSEGQAVNIQGGLLTVF